MQSLVTLKKYKTYKNSNVDWLGQIPDEWDMKPGLIAFSENKIKNRGMKESTVLSLSYGNIVIKPKEKLVGLVPESFETYQLVDAGDIIIRSTDLQNDKTSMRIGLAKDKGIITSAYISLKIKPTFDSRFIYYYLHALDTTKVIYKFGSGLRQNLSFNDFKRLPIFDISLVAQEAIATFLDEKTAQIDEAIAIKEKQIELLEERKKIIIQKAVTQGLNPDVRIRVSSANVVGKIPEHWKISKFKFLAKVRYGLGQPPKMLEGGLKIIRATNVERGKIVEKGMLYVDPSDIPWDRNPVLALGELIVVRSGAYTGDSALVTREYEGTIAGYDMVASPFNCLPAFLSYALLSGYVLLDQIYPVRMRSAQPHLNAEELNELLIAVPPLKEQSEIANYLKQFDLDFDRSVKVIYEQIEKLKEYKTTLINSVVTGKIKVV